MKFEFRNELSQLFLPFTDSNSDKYPTLDLGKSIYLFSIDIHSVFLASIMFNHLQHFLLYYNRMKAKTNSSDLQQVFSLYNEYDQNSFIIRLLVIVRSIELYHDEFTC